MSPGRQAACKPKSQGWDQLLPSDLATELTNGETLQDVPGVKMNSWGSLRLKFTWRESGSDIEVGVFPGSRPRNCS